MSYNDSGVYRNPVPPSGYGAQPVVYEQAGGMNLPGMQQGYGGRQSNSFFHKMGLNDYYDTPPHSGREERADDSPSSSDDDDDEDNGIFDGVLGKIFGGGGNQQQYQQQQDQGGISGAISGLIGKVTGHGGSSQGGMGMGMGQIDPAWAMQQRQSIYGGGIRSGAVRGDRCQRVPELIFGPSRTGQLRARRDRSRRWRRSHAHVLFARRRTRARPGPGAEDARRAGRGRGGAHGEALLRRCPTSKGCPSAR
ncbi:hypothetical protein DFJ74DRAFT_772313 [Hyaloraphidium curvatum]|nr:hypothetical protein DFJ74DRAFT_772313 [Hyaloraphidium curvatum]